MKKEGCQIQELDIDTEVESKWEKCLVHISSFEKRMEDLENSIKAFLEMQCMIGEESVNTFEVIVDRIGHLEKAVNGLQRPEKQIPAEDPTSPGYYIQSCLNRENFLSLQRHFHDDQKTGIGELTLGRLRCLISYRKGMLVSAEIDPVPDFFLEELERLEEIRAEKWEMDSKGNLVSLLSGMIQTKASYLGGISLVLQKLSREQIIAKLLAQRVLFFKKGADPSYTAEAIFYYVADRWPQNGKQFENFKFVQHDDVHSEREKWDLISLVARVEQFLAVDNLQK